MPSCFLHAHLFRFRYAVPTFPSGAIPQSVFSGTVTILLSDLLSIGKNANSAHLVRECQEEMGRAVPQLLLCSRNLSEHYCIVH